MKHCSVAKAQGLGTVGHRFINKLRPSLEAQVCNLADEIAYNNHDIDDGLRSGLITIDQLLCVDLFSAHWHDVRRKHPGLAQKRAVPETIRRMISTLVLDLVICTKNKLYESRVNSLDEVRQAASLVAFTEATAVASRQLKQFLRGALYSHPSVNTKMAHAKTVVATLFSLFDANPQLMPADHYQHFEVRGHRAIADYIAGMTDRFALKEYERFTSAAVNLR